MHARMHAQAHTYAFVVEVGGVGFGRNIVVVVVVIVVFIIAQTAKTTLLATFHIVFALPTYNIMFFPFFLSLRYKYTLIRTYTVRERSNDRLFL